MIADPVDVNETELDDWRDEGDRVNTEDELSNPHSVHTHELKSKPPIDSHGDDKKAQTFHRSEVNCASSFTFDCLSFSCGPLKTVTLAVATGIRKSGCIPNKF